MNPVCSFAISCPWFFARVQSGAGLQIGKRLKKLRFSSDDCPFRIGMEDAVLTSIATVTKGGLAMAKPMPQGSKEEKKPVPWRPFTEMARWEREMEDMFDDFFGRRL